MALDQQRIREFQEAAKALGEQDFLGSAFGRGLGASFGEQPNLEAQETAAEQAHDLDPGKEHRDALKKKALDYAIKGGNEDISKAGLRLNQVNVSGSDAAGGKSDKERKTRQGVIDEMLRQLADINRRIQWYEDEIGQLAAALSHVENEIQAAGERLRDIDELIDLRDRGEFDPENDPEDAARLKALGISVEEYLADPGALDRAAQSERDRIRNLEAEASDLNARINDYTLKADELKDERDELSKELVELGADPTIEQVRIATEKNNEEVVNNIAYSAVTSEILSDKVYASIGVTGKNQDDLSILRSGGVLEAGGTEPSFTSTSESDMTSPPPFAVSDAEPTRSTSSAKQVAEPPFMTANLSEEFEKAHDGSATTASKVENEKVVAALPSAHGFRTA